MKLTETISLLEKRFSAEGRKVYSSKEGVKRNIKKSFKGQVRNYDSISQALNSGEYGEVFTTKAAGRLYVITKGKWGAKSGRGKVAKGFTPGSATPNASGPSIKKHAARTKIRYGEGSRKLIQKYGSRSMKKDAGLQYQ